MLWNERFSTASKSPRLSSTPMAARASFRWIHLLFAAFASRVLFAVIHFGLDRIVHQHRGRQTANAARGLHHAANIFLLTAKVVLSVFDDWLLMAGTMFVVVVHFRVRSKLCREFRRARVRPLFFGMCWSVRRLLSDRRFRKYLRWCSNRSHMHAGCRVGTYDGFNA